MSENQSSSAKYTYDPEEWDPYVSSNTLVDRRWQSAKDLACTLSDDIGFRRVNSGHPYELHLTLGVDGDEPPCLVGKLRVAILDDIGEPVVQIYEAGDRISPTRRRKKAIMMFRLLRMFLRIEGITFRDVVGPEAEPTAEGARGDGC